MKFNFDFDQLLTVTFTLFAVDGSSSSSSLGWR